MKINHKLELKNLKTEFESARPACYPETMQFGLRSDILQILDKSNMQCLKLTYHLVQEGI